MSDPIVSEAQQALNAGGTRVANLDDVSAIVSAHKELLSLHEVIAHRIFQILVGQHRGRTFSIGG